MPAYVIGTVLGTDPALLDACAAQITPAVERYGGRVRGVGPVTVLDGDGSPSIATVIEFPSELDAAAWYDSPDVQALRSLTTATVVLVDAAEGRAESDHHMGDMQIAQRESGTCD
jgi:uncharacterized protein (DUF1330 family)